MERRPEARLGVADAEEVAAGADLADGLERQAVLVHDDRVEEGRHHPQEVGVEHELGR